MYSPRRRYRRYQSKKYYRNNLFAPSLHKANMPTYYQMKGRILQQSPSHIKNTPTEMLSRPKLDAMYKTLVKAKYPIPSPVPFDPRDYTFSSVSGQYNLGMFNEHFTFDLNVFQGIVDQIQKPDPPSGYHYLFDVVNILFSCATISQPDDSLFAFTWFSPLLSNRTQDLISKTVTSSSLNATTTTIQSIPYNVGNAYVTKINVGTTNFQYNLILKSTTDLNIDDNGYYSFVTSDPTSDTYGSELRYECINTSLSLNSYFLRFKILLYLTAD